MNISALFRKTAITRIKVICRWKSVKTNYDHPSSMDHSLLFQHLQMLRSGQPIELPVYSYVEHTVCRKPFILNRKVIILEGILLLTDARLRNELNFSIFVDTRWISA